MGKRAEVNSETYAQYTSPYSNLAITNCFQVRLKISAVPITHCHIWFGPSLASLKRQDTEAKCLIFITIVNLYLVL